MSNLRRRISVIYQTFDEAKVELEGRIRQWEQKYGMSSEEMLKLVSVGDDKWESLEILKWRSAYRAYQSLLAKATFTDGTVGITTETSTAARPGPSRRLTWSDSPPSR